MTYRERMALFGLRTTELIAQFHLHVADLAPLNAEWMRLGMWPAPADRRAADLVAVWARAEKNRGRAVLAHQSS